VHAPATATAAQNSKNLKVGILIRRLMRLIGRIVEERQTERNDFRAVEALSSSLAAICGGQVYHSRPFVRSTASSTGAVQ
jgi:hypothetical protein